jgi:glutamate-ammonia-ligase adenylyltransferase
MVSSLEGFKEYQQKRAWVWEQQALVRARVVAGDRELGKRFDKLRRELLEQPRERQQLLEEVAKMRDRISEQHVRARAGDEDLKRASGGIVDIEFMVQYLVLANASDHPSLTEYTDNVRILDEVARLKLLPDEVVERLTAAYLGLRAEWHRSVLDIPDTERASRTLSRYRDDVTTTWELLFDRGNDQ